MSLNNLSLHIDVMSDYADKTLIFFAYCYIFNLFNWFFLGSILNIFGIIPRNLFGLCGIFFYPVLHGDSKHFFSNALPLYLLIIFCLAIESFYTFLTICLICHILTAAGLWFFARNGVHIGASALVSALYGWLLTVNINEPSISGFIILFILLAYLGSILSGLMPQEKNISWEGHLIGFTSGIITYFLKQDDIFYIIKSNVVYLANLDIIKQLY